MRDVVARMGEVFEIPKYRVWCFALPPLPILPGRASLTPSPLDGDLDFVL